jgi:hypothetical protein
MIEPSKCSCDFCNNEIRQGDHLVKIDLPIPPSVRKEVIAQITTEMQTRPMTSPLSAMMPGPEQMVPHTWTLECCAPCAFGILPGAREKVITQIRDMLQRRIEIRRRAEDAARELDEAETTA